MATRMQQRRGTAAQWISTNSGNGPILAAGEIGFESDTNKFKVGDGVNHWVDLTYFTDADSITAALNSIIDGAPEALNTLNELAAALGDDANFLASLATQTYVDTAVSNSTFDAASAAGGGIDWNVATEQFDVADNIATTSYVDTTLYAHTSDTTSVHGISDTAELATNTSVGTAISDHNVDTTNVHGIIDTSLLATTADVSIAQTAAESYADNAVGTHSSDTTGVHGITDTAELATKTYADNSVNTHNSDTTLVHGIADTAELATKTYADGAVSTHSSDTTGVHGISDTSLLATTTGVDSSISTAISDHNLDTTNVHGILDTADLATKTYADNAVSTHSSDTTSVHGITDTSVLATQTDIQDAKDYADDQIDAHVAITTNVHGISDTSDIVLKSAATQTLSGDIIISGDLEVSGTTTTVSAQDLVVTDPLIYIGEGNTGNLVDLGLVSSYDDGTYQHSGIVRDSSAGTWKFFKGVTDEPTTTINFSQGSLDDLAVNNITAAGVVFTDGTQTKEGVVSRTPIIQKTDSYTLSSLTERDSLIEVSKSTATTITIPGDSTVDYPIGTSIDILQTSTGQVTIAGAGGVTVNATPGLKLRTQWSSATLFKRAANTWVVMGDLSA